MLTNTCFREVSSVAKMIACLICFCAVSIFVGAETFVTFPEQKQLVSPDGQYLVRSIDTKPDPGEFSGVFHSLLLENKANGKSRKVYDYVRRVAVAWSADDRLIVTDYVNPKQSRAMIFSVDESKPAVVLDKVHVAEMVSPDQAAHLSGNDHVYVEASKLQGQTLSLRIWGYGLADKNGFSLLCDYRLDGGGLSCANRR